MNAQSLSKTLLAATLSLTATTALATENGSPSTAVGLYDFGAGFMPPATPGGALGMRTAYYSATDLKDGDGDSAPVDFSMDVLSVAVAYIKMTDYELLGGKYGFGVVLPFFHMDGSVDVPTPIGTFSDGARVFRQADLQVLPLILQWNPSRSLGVNAQFQVQAPTGDYDEDRFVSPGLNHWTFSPILNATHISEFGFEVSSSFQLDFNTRNDDTDYRSGTEYRHEFGIGQHVGNWTLGIGGYYYRQITDDDAPSLSGGNRAQALAAGPAVSFFKPGLPAVWFHVYQEFEARNRAEGYNIGLRIAKSF